MTSAASVTQVRAASAGRDDKVSVVASNGNGTQGTYKHNAPTHRSDSPYFLAPTQQKVDLNLRIICSSCKDPVPNLVEDYKEGDLLCGNCGLVIGDRIIDTRSEWRTFSNDEGGDDPSRVGAAADAILGTAHQLDTMIGGGKGNEMNMDGKGDLNRAHSKSSWGGKSERNILSAFNDIQIMTEHIGLTRSISDIAKQLYKRVEDERLLKGKSQEAIIAVCIMIACRQENVPRTFKEICELTNVPKKEVGRVFKALVPLLGSKSGDGKTTIRVPSMASEDLMSRFCSNLNLKIEVQKAAAALAKRSRDVSGLSGKSPVSIAAACIYLVSHLYGTGKSARDISLVAGVSEVTIKHAYKFLYEARTQVIPEEIQRARDITKLPAS